MELNYCNSNPRLEPSSVATSFVAVHYVLLYAIGSPRLYVRQLCADALET